LLRRTPLRTVLASWPGTRLKQAPGARGRCPACDALKIRCRSRRTSSSTVRQSMASQSRRSSSGPFTPGPPLSQTRTRDLIVPNLPFGSGDHTRSSSKAHPPHVSTLSGPGIGPVSGQLCGTGPGEDQILSRFPVAFRPPAFASWASCSRSASAFLTVGLPARQQLSGRTGTGFPRSTRMRHDRIGCPQLPRDGGAPTTDTESSAAACRFPTASPAPRCRIPPSGAQRNGA
jgi:hypothetical protein